MWHPDDDAQRKTAEYKPEDVKFRQTLQVSYPYDSDLASCLKEAGRWPGFFVPDRNKLTKLSPTEGFNWPPLLCICVKTFFCLLCKYFPFL